MTILTKEQKQQDLFYEENWQLDCPNGLNTLAQQIWMSVDSKYIPRDTLEEKVEYLLKENEKYKRILFTLITKLPTLKDINNVLGTEIMMISK